MKAVIAFLVVSVSTMGVCWAEDLLILTDDSGTYSYPDDIGDLVDSMSPTPSYLVQTNNGDSGVYSSDEDFLSDFGAVFWYASGAGGYGRTTSTAELNACQSYIDSGGHMLVTGYDLIGSPDDPNMAQIINSATYGDGPFTTGMEIVEEGHFIVDGPYGTFTGSFYVSQTDHDQLTPGTDAVEVITITGSANSKCICTDYSESYGGTVVGWVGNRGDDDFISFSDLGDMFKNWLSYLTYPTSVQPTSLGQIKALYQ